MSSFEKDDNTNNVSISAKDDIVENMLLLSTDHNAFKKFLWFIFLQISTWFLRCNLFTDHTAIFEGSSLIKDDDAKYELSSFQR